MDDSNTSFSISEASIQGYREISAGAPVPEDELLVRDTSKSGSYPGAIQSINRVAEASTHLAIATVNRLVSTTHGWLATLEQRERRLENEIAVFRAEIAELDALIVQERSNAQDLAQGTKAWADAAQAEIQRKRSRALDDSLQLERRLRDMAKSIQNVLGDEEPASADGAERENDMEEPRRVASTSPSAERGLEPISASLDSRLVDETVDIASTGDEPEAQEDHETRLRRLRASLEQDGDPLGVLSDVELQLKEVAQRGTDYPTDGGSTELSPPMSPAGEGSRPRRWLERLGLVKSLNNPTSGRA